MTKQVSSSLGHCAKKHSKKAFYIVFALIALSFIALGIGKAWQHYYFMDKDDERGALTASSGQYGDSNSHLSLPSALPSTLHFLDQGWNQEDSMWFYTTTQGSNLLPYDLFVSLEIATGQSPFASAAVFDRYRYIPQIKKRSNPDALAVGFVKDTYQGKDYVGYTCAACHTGQINYGEHAIRIDGGPAMADMVGFLHAMENAMKATLNDAQKQARFVQAVIERDNDYEKAEQVVQDLEQWTQTIENYNTVNRSHIEYGFARLDAFGRIYNRVLQHVINKDQARRLMLLLTNQDGSRMLSRAQVELVLEGVNETIIGTQQFASVIHRLQSSEPGYPDLSRKQMMRFRNKLFNEPNAPVSYPFLWDIAHSDFVQWNGLAANATLGPLGRNAGEVTGVFATLDWTMEDSGFSLAAFITGQKNKKNKIDFKSSINLTNLQRLEAQLARLQSPKWPEPVLGAIDQEKAQRGELIYTEYCESCHALIERDNWQRVVVTKMASLKQVGTDPAMAQNSVNYSGRAGNFSGTWQSTDVGDFITGDIAPVAVILTATTKGVVGTPDPDKWFIRRWLDYFYLLGAAIFDNEIKPSIKQGVYDADVTSAPFQSLFSYKARSLNGIWATAPYLHNGSVPTLYDLFLPARREGDPAEGEYRPDSFLVGSREFDPIKVGFRTAGYEGFKFTTHRRGDLNTGHEYAGGKSPQPNGQILPALNEQQRWDLVEFMKTL